MTTNWKYKFEYKMRWYGEKEPRLYTNYTNDLKVIEEWKAFYTSNLKYEDSDDYYFVITEL